MVTSPATPARRKAGIAPMNEQVIRRWTRAFGITCIALLVMIVGCSRHKERPKADSMDAEAMVREEACVDRWLDAHGLDVFGSPEGTLYPGGSPAFDEKTGRALSRLEYVYTYHPDARSACASDR